MEISGIKALVTGASSGIGRAIAVALVSRGARVWGTSRNPEKVQWPEGVEPLRLSLDSTELVEEAWESQSMDRVEWDLVVNNAGFGGFGRYLDTPFDDWESQVKTLLLGTMKLSHLALPRLIERKGCLVNVSSIAADFPVPYMSAYNVAKSGLSAFTESLIIETKASGVKVIDLRPGDIKTAFNRNIVKKSGKNINEGCVPRVWRRIEDRISKSPEPSLVAKKLLKCIQQDRSGTVRAGTFFQASLAPLLVRFVSRNLARSGNIAYYTK